VVCAGTLGAALANAPHFERLGTGAATLPEAITTIYQDRSGLIWLGSRERLLMYDGQTFTPFEHDPSDPSSISDNAIRTVFEDRNGDLWIGTNAGGLNRLDLAARTFQHFRNDPADPSSLSYDSVYAIAEDPDGSLWVGTQRGLNRLDRATGRFQRFTLAADYVASLLVDREGRLWVGTVNGGVHLLDRKSGSFTRYGEGGVFVMLEDDAGALWMGTDSGVAVLDPATGGFRHIRSDPKDPASLSASLVTSLAWGMPGKLWAGTYGGGLNEVEVATGRCRSFRHDPTGAIGLGNDRVVSLLGDRGGTLWIGTWGGGLARIRRSALILASASADVAPPPGLTDVDVMSINGDRRGGLWVGTASGGVHRFDPLLKSWNRFLPDETTGIVQLAETRDGAMWVGTTSGLTRLDPATGRHRAFRHDPADAGSIGPGYVKSVHEDREGRLWIGTGEGGLQTIDANGRVTGRYLKDDFITAIVEDRRGSLWVGTRSGGLNALDPKTGRSTRYQPLPGQIDSFSHHSVMSIYKDAKGTLWAGTAGGGLNRVDDPGDGGPARFTRWTTADGLADNNVMAIAEDDDGSLWLSTKRGLSRFDPAAKKFVNFLVADGLPSAEFEPGAAARIGRTMYFGTVKWIAAIAAGTRFPESGPSPTLVTSVRGPTAELKGAKPAWRLDRLDIPYGQLFSIELAVLDYASELTHAYAYRLGGDTHTWVDLGPRRSITFTDLAPGTYGFRAKGRNDQGVWSETAVPLTITVVPPFWMTFWFRSGVGLALVAGAIVAHQVRTMSLKRRNRELLDLHEQRESARADLNQAYDRLRLLARRLEVAKEEERKTIARELHDELGPTLTAVVINLQLLKDTPDVDRRSRRIAETVEMVDRTIQRVRELSLDLRPPLLDEMGLVTALRGYLETLASRSGVAIEVRGDGGLDGLPPEIEIVAFRVVQEAVTNVLRHAGARRAVVTVERAEGRLRISIEDDGKGFDVARSMEITATGKALGLLGMQERVLMLAGELEIVSTPGGGTIVRASLPAEAAA
jgi:ligand-binding sensor domain-containing protein/signal transduction histidine kinase